MPLPVHVPPGQYEGIDQGIDFSSPSGTFGYALAAGRITKISPRGSWGGGTGAGVYETLDQPIVSGGRTYSQIYYAEEDPAPGIHGPLPGIPGSRIWPGMPVISFSAVQSEFGFASGDEPAGHLNSACCNSSVRTCCWTQEGQDFHDWVYGLASAPAKPAPSPTPAPGGAAPAPGGGPAPPGGSGCPAGQEQLCGGCHDPNGGVGAAGVLHDCYPWETWGGCCHQNRPARDIPAAISTVSQAITFVFSIRFLEILGGAILLLVGIILLGRQLGMPTTFSVKGLAGAG